MIPFRKNVAIAIDGGGLKGAIVTRALSVLEQSLNQKVHDIFRLTAGTSTGSILAAGIAAGMTASEMDKLYRELGGVIFKKSWRSTFWPLTHYRYSSEPLEKTLRQYLGDRPIGDFWTNSPPTDVVITTFDLVENRTRFIKPWKAEYREWTVVKAILASSTVPTYFPVVEGRFVDGGVGAYSNPCYLAAYELLFCLKWDPAETTLLSFGTGRDPHTFNPGEANNLWAWNWIEPVLGAFLESAADQQVHLVNTFFQQLDFRRFQVNLRESIAMDDPSKIDQLTAYGEEMGQMILNDQTDPIQDMEPPPAPKRKGLN